VKKVEQGERRPSDTMAQRFAEALDIPPDQRDAFVATATGDLAPARFVDRTRRSVDRRPEVVGRDLERARLRRHLADTLRDGSRTVFITGEAGQGKTALIDALIADVLAVDTRIVVARGQGTAANGSGDPYLLLRDIVDDLLRGGNPASRQASDDTVASLAQAALGQLAPGLARWSRPSSTSPHRSRRARSMT
jgi:transcriptional regulator with XRE-family HTH domain